MQKLVIPPSDSRRWFFSWDRKVGGSYPSLTFPGFRQSPLARIIEGKYRTKGYERSRSEDLEVTTGEGQSLYRWDLGAGQQICFADWEHIVGWSEGVRFETIINMQIGSLLLREFFFFVASGPGTVILEGGGNLHFSKLPNLPRHEFVRYIAWSRNSKFIAEGSARLHDLLFLTPLVAKVIKTDGILLDPDHRRREERFGPRKLLRWIYRIIP